MTQAQGPHSLQALQARYGERHRWLLLLSVMLGSMAAVMSSTIMNVAIPDMSQHFTLGQSRVQWVTSGFMVAMTVSMLTTPWLLARYGYRRTYSVSMWVLLLGGIGGGLANDFNWVLVARVAEGLAAGVVQPIPAIIILRVFGAGEQGRAGSFFGTGVVLAPAVGPSIGGLLVDALGWRSIFFMVVPLAMASLWMARKYVPTNAPSGQAPNREGPSMDVGGLLLATVSTLCLLNALVSLREANWQTGHAWGLLGTAVAGVLIFVFWQHRLLHHPQASGMRPLMNLSVFQHRAFSMGSAVAFIYGAGLFGSTYLLPLYMQQGMGWSAAYTGTALLPAGLMLALTIALTGRLSDRKPTYVLVCYGLALLAASFVLMATLQVSSSIWWLTTWVILGRVGLGLILPSLNSGSLRGLAHALIPQGSSVINFMRMLGGASGVSLCAIVLQWRLAEHGVSLTSNEHAALRLQAFNETFLFLATLMALAMLAAWQMKAEKTLRPQRPDPTDIPGV
jgi:EmrB/QacA subfamily drug resistance transporter